MPGGDGAKSGGLAIEGVMDVEDGRAVAVIGAGQGAVMRRRQDARAKVDHGEDRRGRQLVQHGQRPTATGTTEVYVVLRNHTDYDYRIEARTQFFDQDGVPTDVKPTWQRSTIPANSIATYRELSTTTQPLQYRVEVRELN